MSKKRKLDKYIFLVLGLLIVIVILTFLIINKNNSIRVIKAKYDYVNKLKNDTEYLKQEYDKLLVIYKANETLSKSNIELDNEIEKLEKEILNVQEKIVKMEATK